MNGGEPRLISRSRNTHNIGLGKSSEQEKDINSKEKVTILANIILDTSTNQGEEGARLENELNDLKDYLLEKRRRLDQLDERQDEIWRNQG